MAHKDGTPQVLGFDGLEERLDHSVIVAISLSRHGDADAVATQLGLVIQGTILGGFNRSSQHFEKEAWDGYQEAAFEPMPPTVITVLPLRWSRKAGRLPTIGDRHSARSAMRPAQRRLEKEGQKGSVRVLLPHGPDEVIMPRCGALLPTWKAAAAIVAGIQRRLAMLLPYLTG